jgi:hypothetical protein
MIVFTKNWYPDSVVTIADLEKIMHIVHKPFTNSDGHWIDDPWKTTLVTYLGFDGEVLDRMSARHPVRQYVQRNPTEANHITAFSYKSPDRFWLHRAKSPIIEYLSYELDIEFREGSVD